MIEKALNKLAEQILSFDEASLGNLRAKYLSRMNDFDTSREWEKAVIIYFMINSVLTKNALFNHHVLAGKGKKKAKEKSKRGGLKVVE